MTVNENIIKRLEEISDYFFSVYHHSKDREEIYRAKDMCDTVENAISLLKEKEEKPVEICGRLGMLKYGNCPRCGKYMNSEVYPHWCGFCGQAVKWNEA